MAKFTISNNVVRLKLFRFYWHLHGAEKRNYIKYITNFFVKFIATIHSVLMVYFGILPIYAYAIDGPGIISNNQRQMEIYILIKRMDNLSIDEKQSALGTIYDILKSCSDCTITSEQAKFLFDKTKGVRRLDIFMFRIYETIGSDAKFAFDYVYDVYSKSYCNELKILRKNPNNGFRGGPTFSDFYRDTLTKISDGEGVKTPTCRE